MDASALEGRDDESADVDAAWRTALAARVARLGLGSSARLILESLRPVSWLGAQALWVAQPTLALLGWSAGAGRLARALESEGGLSGLITALDPPPHEERR